MRGGRESGGGWLAGWLAVWLAWSLTGRVRGWVAGVWLGLLMAGGLGAAGQVVRVAGMVTDPAGRPVAGAEVEVLDGRRAVVGRTASDAAGQFAVSAPGPGMFTLVAKAGGLVSEARPLAAGAGDGAPRRVTLALTMAAGETVAVKSSPAAVDLFAPDAAERVFVREQMLDANPGRPGAPVSVPGYPMETASGGIKAPQYFAPGVAGDHGEPVAQYFAVGGYLVPNNLSANAHGNGYADPNVVVPATVAYVEVDGGSFNVLEGNHAVNLAATYGLRNALGRFAAVTADARDVDVTAGVGNGENWWAAAEGNYGNGFLQRLEHRQQGKVNAERVVERGGHRLTLLGMGYAGWSYIPGLVPLAKGSLAGTRFADEGDTVDPRQREQTHTALAAANDVWTVSARQQVQVSGFLRTYDLSLYSDFGQGLIRQSEFRTVAGGNAEYAGQAAGWASVLAGVDVQREAPRNDDLRRYGFYVAGDRRDGAGTLVDGSDVTVMPVAPYAAVEARWGKFVHAYGGWRRDEIEFDDRDLVTPANSFHRWIGVNSPKATVSVTAGPERWAPVVSASAGESFFTEDPRIGTGTTRGTPVSRAHAYEATVTERAGRTEVRLLLGQTTVGEQLAKIDPDTGLQENQGPGRVRFATVSVWREFGRGWALGTFSKADARDLDTGQPTAEAPRTLGDLVGGLERLPLGLEAKGEFEFVGAKPLGTGCAPRLEAQCMGIAVREGRIAVARGFGEGRVTVGVNALVARGATGQTLETFAPAAAAVSTGVRIPSYVGGNVTYRFGVGTKR